MADHDTDLRRGSRYLAIRPRFKCGPGNGVDLQLRTDGVASARAAKRTQTMNCKSTISFYQAMRQMMALMLSVLLIPAAHLDLYAQPPPTGYIPLTADQLDQLVAPIALDPDALVAQILTSATYPDQVAAANIWSNQNAGLPADQRAVLVNGMPWDPAVKGLTAFP